MSRWKVSIISFLMLVLIGAGVAVKSNSAFSEGLDTSNNQGIVMEGESQEKEQEKTHTDHSLTENYPVEKFSILKSEADKLHEEMANQETIYIIDGVMYYQGEALYYGAGDEMIPAKIDELMQKGSTRTLTTKNQTMTRSSKKNVTVTYAGPASANDIYGYMSMVGIFYINGVQSFYVQHHLPTPGTGTPAEASFYNSQEVANALYYGQSGPESIFSDFNLGTVVTSLVLDRIITGGTTGQNLPQYKELWDKVKTGTAPIGKAPEANRIESNTTLVNNEQLSEDFVIKAEKGVESYIVNVPQHVTLVNKSTGEEATNVAATVKSGDTFYYKADAGYSTPYVSNSIANTTGRYQPVLEVTASASYQNLAYGQWEKKYPINSAKSKF